MSHRHLSALGVPPAPAAAGTISGGSDDERTNSAREHRRPRDIHDTERNGGGVHHAHVSVSPRARLVSSSSGGAASPGPFRHDVRPAAAAINTARGVQRPHTNHRMDDGSAADDAHMHTRVSAHGSGATTARSSRRRALRQAAPPPPPPPPILTVLSPRAAESTIGVNTSITSGLTQRTRQHSSVGYGGKRSVAPLRGLGGSQTARGAASSPLRYDFHAASLSERAATDRILQAADAFGLNHAALAAFNAASLPSSASSSLAHFASHPVTFASQPGVERFAHIAATPPPHQYPYQPPQTAGPVERVSIAAMRFAGQQRRSSYSAHASSHPYAFTSGVPPAFDPTTGAQLPPLGQKPVAKDALTPPPPPPVVKQDRASQTDPVAVATPATTTATATASPAPLALPPPTVNISPVAALTIAPPNASTAATSDGIAASPALPAGVPSGRRHGYELTHSRLLDLYHPHVFAAIEADADLELSLDGDVLHLDSPTVVKEETRSELHSRVASRTHSRRNSPSTAHSRRESAAEAAGAAAVVVSSPSPVDPYSLTYFEDSLASFYSRLGKWDEFDIFQLYELTGGWPLSFLFLMIDKKHHFLEANQVDPVTAFHFIQEVESNYLPSNPYHTATHAGDVLHAAYHLVEHTPLLKNGLSSLDCFVLYISCAVHDFQHPGVNNSFLCNSRAPLALRYNDRSVLESFHISGAFRMMQSLPQCNILGGFAFGEYSKIRKTLIDLVLATDLAVHFELMGAFKRKIATVDLAASEEDRLMIMQIILKCGDLSHPARSRRLHLKWSELVTEEFFLQGDREKVLSLPPSMFMDRHTTNLAQSQIGFITFLVYPMFQAYSAFSARDYWSRRVEENLEWWHEVARVEAEEKKRDAERLERGIDPEQDAIPEGDSEGANGGVAGSEPNSGSVDTSATSSHVASRRASLDSAAGSKSASNSASASRAPSSTNSPTNAQSAAAAAASSSDTAVAPKRASFPQRLKVRPPSDGAADADTTLASAVEPSPRSNKIVVMPFVASPTNADSPTALSAPPTGKRNRRHRSRRSATVSSVSDSLALLSETAQVAALSAAGASATEAKEHQEEEQAEAAAAQQAAAVNTPTTGASAHTLLALLPSHKRKSVMKGVAPPASPLVLHRNASRNSDVDSVSSPSSAGVRSLGVALSERRALSLSVGSSGSTGGGMGSLLSPLHAGSAPGSNRGSMPLSLLSPPSPAMLASAPGSARSSMNPPPVMTASTSDGSTTNNLFERAFANAHAQQQNVAAAASGGGVGGDAVANEDDVAVPLSHSQELEASHGSVYLEVRELASLTGPALDAASLTAPPPAISPSTAGSGVPAFSKKAHALLNATPRPKEATPTGPTSVNSNNKK